MKKPPPKKQGPEVPPVVIVIVIVALVGIIGFFGFNAMRDKPVAPEKLDVNTLARDRLDPQMEQVKNAKEQMFGSGRGRAVGK